jgi:hypothetical protein
VDHLQGEQGVAGDEGRIVFPSAGGVVDPFAVGLLEVDQAEGELLAPVDHGSIGGREFVDVGEGQRLGHGVEIIEQSLRAHERVSPEKQELLLSRQARLA